MFEMLLCATLDDHPCVHFIFCYYKARHCIAQYYYLSICTFICTIRVNVGTVT
jgi:hypothetical protein